MIARMGVPLYLLLLVCASAAGQGRLDLLYKWKSVDFDFPSRATKESMIRSGAFIPGNPIPLDIDVYEKGNQRKIFLTMPRFKDGVPASLVTVSESNKGESPLLKPYPDWSWHTEGQCKGITSAFRTKIDQCERLWIIDSGMVDLFKYPRRRLCQPQLLAFTLATDKIAGKHVFPSNILQEGSVLATVAVDVRDSRCLDTFVYVADVTGFSILVFDARKNKSWRVQSNSMFPYPPYGLFQTNGVQFDLMDGVLGMALAPAKRGGEPVLYYHSFASVRESWVPTSVLRNESLYTTGFNAAPRQFTTTDTTRESQVAPEVFDKNGNLFFGQITKNSLNCWNSEKPYAPENIHELARDNTNLQFNTGIKIHEAEDGHEYLYMLTDRFQIAMVGNMNPEEVNYRILRGKLSDLTRGTPCQVQKNNGGGGGGSGSGGHGGQFTFPKRPGYGYKARPGY